MIMSILKLFWKGTGGSSRKKKNTDRTVRCSPFQNWKKVIIISTANYIEQLLKITPSEFSVFLKQHESELIHSQRPFTDFMRVRLREKGIQQQEAFIQADLPMSYGYKLISGEKHTRQRDTILRICLASKLSLEQTQEALVLYGMSKLHCRIPRDMAFIVAINNKMFDIHSVNLFLQENGLLPMK